MILPFPPLEAVGNNGYSVCAEREIGKSHELILGEGW